MIKILDVAQDCLVFAEIRKAKYSELPSIQEGWILNFNKHSNLPNAQAYVLTASKTPTEIEGCLIFQMREGVEPYMSFVEISPKNKQQPKKYDYVAGCLIAYACRLSFEHGKGNYEGWLMFNVTEEPEEERETLIKLYHDKYGAARLDKTGLLIKPDKGKELIENFLK